VSAFEELLLKWQDGSLAEEERRELNALLAQPEARARLVREFQFDALTRESLRQKNAEAAAKSATEDFQNAEVREPVFERRTRWRELLGLFVRNPVLRFALPALVLALGAWLALRPDPAALLLSAESRNVTIMRGSRSLADAGEGFTLRPGDRVMVADGGSVAFSSRAPSAFATIAGPAELVVASTKETLELDLVRGELSVATSGGREVRIRGSRAVTTLDHGEMTVQVEPDAVRLEVASGSARLHRLDDGRELSVPEGHFARLGADQLFAALPLVPAPWLAQDVGEVAEPIVARFDGSSVRVAAGRRGPPGGWGRYADGGKGRGRGRGSGDGAGFHFVYRALRGDGEIRGRVVPDPGAPGVEVGLAIRRDLSEQAPMVIVGSEAGKPPEFRRGFRGGRRAALAAADDDSRRGRPYWMRLVRQGDSVTAYRSGDGQQWTETGTEKFDLGETAFVGLAAMSLAGGSNSAVTFDQITIAEAR
jgi:hypothetical protein